MTEIIWLDPEVENNENTEYFNQLNQLNKFHITRIKTVEQSINKIIEIAFSEAIIIVSGKLYIKFIDEFQKNINDVCLIPKIIIFTANYNEFLNSIDIFHRNYLNNKFYNSGGIVTNFQKVIEFVKNPNSSQKKNIFINRDDGQISFDYIDTKKKLIWQLLYKHLIEVNKNSNIEFLRMLHKKYYKKSEVIRKFLDSISDSINDIPIEVLCKFYIRIFTDEDSKFYSDLNGDLRKNIRDIYLPYIKVLYEGVKLKALPLSSENILFRGSFLLLEEIKKMEDYKGKPKKDGLPGGTIFSKSFLSFTKNKKVAENFYNNQIPINTSRESFKVLFILIMEISQDIDKNYCLSTHTEIGKLSVKDDEEEVLFFPFSSFEIIDVELQKNGVYEIKIRHLGIYFENIERDLNLLKIAEEAPKSKFTDEIINSGLIKKSTTDNLIQKYEVNKQESRQRRKPIYPKFNPIYPVYNTINPIYNPFYGKPSYIIKRFKIPTIDPDPELPEELPNPPPLKPAIPNPPLPQPIKNKPNFIIGLIYIGERDVNKFIRVINSYEQAKSRYNYIKVDNELIFKNEKEFMDNCGIKINGKIYPFNYVFKFHQPGYYFIEYSFKSNITKTDFMFAECYNLISLDLLSFNFKEVKNMIGMFLECVNIKQILLSNLETGNITNMNSVFSGCKSLEYLDLKFFNTKNVVNMSRLFFGCESLKNINLSSFNTQNVIDMYAMFYDCKSLLNLDLLHFYTQNVTNMTKMFYGCNKLKQLDLSNFMTNKVEYMNSMFFGCYSLIILNIENFNFDKIINMEAMFDSCVSLKRVICRNRNKLHI